tara:strand:- start:1559 stop:2206 length:648 start_codon:yes stop_codon:yes gene_type:complete
MIKAIIFDYDGVIVDSFQTMHQIYKVICSSLGKEYKEDLEEFRIQFGYNYHECCRNLGFSEEDKVKSNMIYSKEVLKFDPPLFEGIEEVLQKLGEKFTLFMLSSNSKPAVTKKLTDTGLSKFFKEILGHPTGKDALNKPTAFRELLAREGLKESEVIAIGDRINDYHGASEAGISNVLLVEYGWGYDKNDIPDHKQSTIINKPSDILIAVNDFSK